MRHPHIRLAHPHQQSENPNIENMKTSFKHYLAGVSVALALVPTADAAYNTSLIYGEIAYAGIGNNSFNRFQTEADSCYNALISISPPAALAGFYTYELRSYTEYYYSFAASWQYYFIKLGYADLPNLATYLQQAQEIAIDYYDAAGIYSSAYSSYTSVFGWGGDYDDQADQKAYDLAHIYAAYAAIYNAVHPQFQGSYYQYKLVYDAVAKGVYDVYRSAGDVVYAQYTAVSDPTAFTKANVYYQLADTESQVWRAYAQYYEWLAIASE